ncbi:hypothetical protein [Streptomyces sp. NPDC048560]
MSENAGGWWTCWGCGNSQPACLRAHRPPDRPGVCRADRDRGDRIID